MAENRTNNAQTKSKSSPFLISSIHRPLSHSEDVGNIDSDEIHFDESAFSLSMDSNEELSTLNRSSLRRCNTCDDGLWSTSILQNNHGQSVSRASIVKRLSFYGPERDSQCRIRMNDLEELDLVGEGAFGRVIKVRHKETNNIYVMKEVIDHSRENMESLLKEVVTLRSLSHRNVLKCIGVTVKDRSLCLVSEFIDGGPLHKIITDKSYDLNWTLRACYARDIAAGMEYLHYNSIVHRDLNSPNCLVRKANSVVVADFGLSIFLQKEDECRQILMHRCNLQSTPSRQRPRLLAVGNPYGMAPEMLAGKDYNDKVDVYSFGVIICELMTRLSSDPDDLPRDPKTFAMDMDALSDNQLINSGYPIQLFKLAKKCCFLNPVHRPSFEECHSSLERLVFHLETNTVLPDHID